ncbi:MAG: cyclic peptide export ABC transporter [Myxococcota bacterium]
MRVVRFIMRAARGPVVWTAGISLLSGLFNAGLIAVVHRALVSPEGTGLVGLALAFVALGLGKLVTGYFSEVMLTRYAQQAIARLRIDLVRQLLQVPHDRFSQVGPARVYAALTDDVGQVGQTLYLLPALTVNLAILGGGALYLLYLSWVAIAVIAALVVVGGATYRLLSRRAYRALDDARAEHDRLVAHFVTLTRGFKELKLHRPRRRAFVTEELTPTADRLVDHNVRSHARYILAHATSHFFFFALIGAVVFAVPTLTDVGSDVLTGYVLTCLYLMGPLSGAVGALPRFAAADVALRRVESLGVQLESATPEAPGDVAAQWSSIALKGVTRDYEHPKYGRLFTLGPIDLTVRPGEVLFITGSNGSGKSTLARLLSGLDTPEQGEVVWDETVVDSTNRDDYRQLFSAVFSDFYVFDRLLGLDATDADGRAEKRLRDLQLAHKVTIADGVLSSTDLSQGQRKRLALLTAYLEDRPIYLFDEWAADQDPEFKEVFYHQLIPELRALGKAVIVITHDDRYFDLADRRIRLGDGKITNG